MRNSFSPASLIFSDPAPFSESRFWAKVKSCAKKAGTAVIYNALLLYYTLVASSTTVFARGVIVAALAYFVNPLDVIPDCILVEGFVDDLAVLLYAVSTVKAFITDSVKAKALRKMTTWMPSFKPQDEA